MNNSLSAAAAGALGLVMASALAACGGGSGAGGSGDLSGKQVTLITCPNSNAVCSTWSSDVKESLEAEGAEVTVYTHDFDAAEQVQAINQAVSARPDLIILQETADSKSVIPALAKAAQQQVPVIGVDGRAEDEAVDSLTSQVIFDQVELGRVAARNLIGGLEAAGKDSGNVIAITGASGTLLVNDRMQGFDEVMAEHPNYEVVAVEDSNWDLVKSGQLAQQLLAQNSGNIDAAYGMADYLAIPIAQAARQVNLPVGLENDGMIVTGGNCTAAGIESIRRGELYGTTTQNPTTLAEYTADAAKSFLNGEELPEIVDVPGESITAANVDEFAEPCSF